MTDKDGVDAMEELLDSILFFVNKHISTLGGTQTEQGIVCTSLYKWVKPGKEILRKFIVANKDKFAAVT